MRLKRFTVLPLGKGEGSTKRESPKSGEMGDPLGRATHAPHRRELPPDERVSPASGTGATRQLDELPQWGKEDCRDCWDCCCCWATVGFCWTNMGWKDHCGGCISGWFTVGGTAGCGITCWEGATGAT